MAEPTKLPRPFADQGNYESIPDSTTVHGHASYQKGFPSETALPLSQGGVPPRWLDFQGILHDITAHICHLQKGGHYTWDNSTDYPVGAMVVGSNGKLYVALKATGPTSSGSAVNPTTDNGTNWQSFNLTDYLPLSGGTMTGSITFKNNETIRANTTTDFIAITACASGYLNGARLALHGKDRGSLPGAFELSTGDGSSQKKLTGKPDGTLTWDGTDVSLNGHTHSYLPLTGGTLNNTSSAAGTNGNTGLVIGNAKSIDEAGNSYGRLALWGQTAKGDTAAHYTWIIPARLTGNRTHTLPNATGYLATGSTSGVGGARIPAYMNSGGALVACTMFSGTGTAGLADVGFASLNNSTPSRTQTVSGYFQIGNLLICYGHVASGNGSGTVTFPRAFTSVTSVVCNISAGSTADTHSGGWGESAAVSDVKAASFRYNTTSSTGMSWIAIGYHS